MSSGEEVPSGRARRSSPLRLGLFLNTQWPKDATVAIDDVLAQTHAARDSGFESLWLPHHYLVAPMQMFQPLTLLGRLVPESGNMRLGTNILISPLLNPTLVAEEWATLDVLSDGRAVLGVGLGSRPEEFTAFGVQPKQRVGRMTESIELMRRLWTEDVVTFEGNHFTVRDAGISLKPRQPGGPKILIGAVAEAGVRRAARLGDGWLIGSVDTRAEVMDRLPGYRAAWTDAGRAGDAPALLVRECYVGSSHKSAFEECRPALEAKFAAYQSWGAAAATIAKSSPPDLSGVSTNFEEFARERFIIGDKVSVQEELNRYREELDIDNLILRTHWLGLPAEASVRTIEAAGKVLG